MRSSWVETEDEFLRENYKILTIPEMAEQLKRTKSSVQHRLNRAGLLSRESPDITKNSIEAGSKFNRLTVLEIFRKECATQNATFAKCQCDCGNITDVKLTTLVHKNIQSCGCVRDEKARDRASVLSYKHGKSGTRLFSIWCGMKSRCRIKSNLQYKDYGGRGVTICQEWLTYLNFQTWAHSHGYQDGLSIERKDVNGNYEPDNCTWATAKTQNNNKRSNVFITAFGETKTVTQWSEDTRANTTPYQIRYRIKQGWKPEEAIVTPTLQYRVFGKNGPEVHEQPDYCI